MIHIIKINLCPIASWVISLMNWNYYFKHKGQGTYRVLFSKNPPLPSTFSSLCCSFHFASQTKTNAAVLPYPLEQILCTLSSTRSSEAPGRGLSCVQSLLPVLQGSSDCWKTFFLFIYFSLWECIVVVPESSSGLFEDRLFLVCFGRFRHKKWSRTSLMMTLLF